MLIRMIKSADDSEQLARGLDRLLNPVFRYETVSPATSWRPPTDVYETDNAVVIKVEVAGMNPDDFEISFAERILQIRGNRIDKQRKRSYHCLEVQYGEFLSQVYLPGNYAKDKIEAHYENGFLTIILPKITPESHTITVQSPSEE